MWIKPTGETTKKNARCCLPRGSVETATMKQFFFGKFEKLLKIFRIFEKFFSNIPESREIFQDIQKFGKKICFPLESFKKITEVH